MTSKDNPIIYEVQDLIIEMLHETVTLHKNIEWGRIGYTLYSDYFELANYHIDSAVSIIELANNKHYRDSAVVARSYFEFMLFFRLMTRGNRYFRLAKKKKKESDQEAIDRINDDFAEKRKEGIKVAPLRAVKYPPKNGYVAIVYKGPYVDGKDYKGNLYPFYLSLYNQFRPDAAFLPQNDYFQWNHERKYKKENDNRNAKQKAENKYLHLHFMSFEGMLFNLKLNRLFTVEEIKRIRAHYAFLSKYIHTTDESIESIKVENRHKGYLSGLHEVRDEFPSFQYLMTLYAGWISASISEDLTHVLNHAPKKYIKKIETDLLEEKISKLYEISSYFWFIKNEPHAYDRFQHCVAYENPAQLKGKYMDVEDNKVKFKTEILGRFLDLQYGWRNIAWGRYEPPFTLKGNRPK